MKVITLSQPWATLVAIGAKKIETRSWSTTYRGSLAIHAAAGLGPVGGKSGLAFQCCCEPFLSTLRAAGIRHHEDLPLGAIVAVCDLFDCRPMTEAAPGKIGWFAIVGNTPTYWDLTDQERAFGDYSAGRYAWLLANVRALPEPIPAKGALSLWEYPGEITTTTGEAIPARP